MSWNKEEIVCSWKWNEISWISIEKGVSWDWRIRLSKTMEVLTGLDWTPSTWGRREQSYHPNARRSQGSALYCQWIFSVALSWLWLLVAVSLADFQDRLLLVKQREPHTLVITSQAVSIPSNNCILSGFFFFFCKFWFGFTSHRICNTVRMRSQRAFQQVAASNSTLHFMLQLAYLIN